MSGIMDRLGALGRGAAQSATGGWVDDLYPKILDALPRKDDGTGIPREYAGGSAENQYKNEYRADDASAAAKYPLNFGGGALLGAAPAAIATGGLGVPGAVGMGVIQGAGSADDGSKLKGAVKGGALGGLFSTAGNIAQAAAPSAKIAFDKLRQGPPPGLQPALATATAEAAPAARVAKNEFGAPQINRMVPPRPTTEDLTEIVPELPEQSAKRAVKGAEENAAEIAPDTLFRKRPVRAENLSELPPPRSSQIPKAPKAPKPLTDAEEEELLLRERQTADEDTARRMKRVAAKQNPQGESMPARPNAKKRAAKKSAPEQTGLALAPKQVPAPVPQMSSMDRPLVGPKQLSDDRILELARAGREANPQPPQPAAGLSPEQLEQGKQMLRDQFQKMSGGGNVVDLGEGAIQVADDPVIAGRVREFQQHAKAAEAAGDPEQAAWFRDRIEEMLTGS